MSSWIMFEEIIVLGTVDDEAKNDGSYQGIASAMLPTGENVSGLSRWICAGQQRLKPGPCRVTARHA